MRASFPKLSQTHLGLFLLVLLALLCFRPGAPVWYDEMATWLAVSGKSPWGVVRFLVEEQEPFPPFYFLVVNFFASIFGDSPFVLRLPSILAGAASLPILFFLGKRLFNETTGWIAAMLGLVSFNRLQFATEARPYAFLFGGSALLALLYWKFLERKEEPSRWDKILLGLTAALLAYTHFFGLVIVGIAGLHALLFAPRARWAFVGAGLLYLPWLPNTLHHLIYAPSNQNIPYRSPWKVISRSLESHLFDVEIVHHGLLYFTIYLVWALLAFVFAHLVFSFLKQREGWRADLFLFLWFLIPLLLVIVKGEISLPVYRAKYLIITSPACLLLLARGLGLLSRWWPGKILAAGFLGLVAWFSFGVADILHTDFYRKDREASDYIHANWQEGAALVPCAFETDPLKFYFRHDQAVIAAWGPKWVCKEDSLREEIAKHNEQTVFVWLAMRRFEAAKVLPVHYRLADEWESGAHKVWRLERKGR